MDATTIFLLIAGLGSILISITLHEAMHAFVSHWLGDDTAYLSGRLTLNPLAHIDPFLTVLLPLMLLALGLPPFGAAKPVPFNPYKVRYGEYGAALVGVAGPLTNLALAAVAGLSARFALNPELLADSPVGAIFIVFIFVNIGFFVFNMIPFPPLDGSRLLYAFAPEGVQRFMRSIEAGGFLSIVIFMFAIFPILRPIIVNLVPAIASFFIGQDISL